MNRNDDVFRRTSPVGPLVLIATGGASGTLARYGVAELLPKDAHLTVFGINLFGALLLGLLVTSLAGGHPRIQLLLGTGFCGGFTTYSIFALHVVESAASGDLSSAVWLALATVVGGALATLAGVGIGYAVRTRTGSSRADAP